MAPKTRQYFLLGDPIDKISGSEMPTLQKMLQFFLFNHFQGGLSVKESLRTCIEEGIKVWNKMNVPIRRKDKILEKLTKEYNEWSSLDRNRHMDTHSMRARQRNFIEKLNEPFDVKPAESLVKSQPTPRSETPEKSTSELQASGSDLRKRTKNIEAVKKIGGLFDKRGRFADQILDKDKKSIFFNFYTRFSHPFALNLY